MFICEEGRPWVNTHETKGKVFFKESIDMSRRVVFRRKKQNYMGMLTIFVLVALFCCVLSYRKVELKNKRDEYNKRIEALQEQIDEQEDRTRELQEYEKYTKTVKYVEEVAKEKLGLVYEDEIVFESGVQEQE